MCNLLSLSRVRPRKAGNDEIPGLKADKHGNHFEFDFAEQYHSVFDNVGTILEANGSSWNKLVDVTVFLVEMKHEFQTYNNIYAEYFNDSEPCYTTADIDSLPSAITIELKCMAELG